MISEQEYFEAKKTVDAYIQQQVEETKRARDEWLKEVAKCQHHYIPSGDKWSSMSQRTCRLCGHTIY